MPQPIAKRSDALLYSAKLRASTVVTTPKIHTQPGLTIFALTSSLDQNMSVQFQGALDSDATKWVNIGAPVILVATSGNGAASLTAPWKWVHAVVTPGGVPTTGQIDIYWAWSAEV